MNEYAQDNRLFGLLKSFNSWRATHLYPFNDTYIGVDTKEAYKISTSTWGKIVFLKLFFLTSDVNYIRVAFFLGGIFLYLFAGDLVRNVVFYYTSGCTIGLLASVLLVAIIVYRLAPKVQLDANLIFIFYFSENYWYSDSSWRMVFCCLHITFFLE